MKNPIFIVFTFPVNSKGTVKPQRHRDYGETPGNTEVKKIVRIILFAATNKIADSKNYSESREI